MKKVLALACIACSLQASVELEQPVLNQKVEKKECVYPNVQERKAILTESLKKEAAGSGIVVKCSLNSWAKNTYCFNQKTLEEMVKRAHNFALDRSSKYKRSNVVTLTDKDMKKAFREVMKDYGIKASRSSLTRVEKVALGVTAPIAFVVISGLVSAGFLFGFILCGGNVSLI